VGRAERDVRAGRRAEVAGEDGCDARLDAAPTWDAIRAEVAKGKPVIVSTAGHYFTLDDFDPASGKFHVGTSGTDLKQGSEWMDADEITTKGQGVNGALYINAGGANVNQTTAGSARSPEPLIPRSTAAPPVTRLDVPEVVTPTMGEQENDWLFGHGRTMPDTGRRGSFVTKAPEPTDADYERMLRQVSPGYGTVPELYPEPPRRSYDLPGPRVNGTKLALPSPAELMGVA
jgi:hypothetical protein